MATASGNFYGEYSKQSRLRLYWEYTQDIANNCDYFYSALYAQKAENTGSHNSNYHNSVYWLTGFTDNKLINGTGDYTWGANVELFIGETRFTHYHNDDGTTANVAVSGSWYTNLTSSSVVGERMEVAGTVTGIPTIPRYAIISHSLNSKTINSVKVNWSSDSTCDRVEYKIGSGSWVTVSTSSAKSGSYTISNLNPNTTYSIYTRVRRADSQLYTTSSGLSVTTYDVAKISSASDFELGDSTTIVVSNPGNGTVNFEMKIAETSILTRTLATGTNIITFTDKELDNIYKNFGINNTVSIICVLTTNNTWSNSKIVTCTLTGEQKTGHTNVDGIWKRTKRWINVNGTWKRTVRWVKVDSTWKRCI